MQPGLVTSVRLLQRQRVHCHQFLQVVRDLLLPISFLLLTGVIFSSLNLLNYITHRLVFVVVRIRSRQLSIVKPTNTLFRVNNSDNKSRAQPLWVGGGVRTPQNLDGPPTFYAAFWWRSGGGNRLRQTGYTFVNFFSREKQ